MYEISATVEEAWQYETVLFAEQVFSALTNDAPYIEHTNRQKWVMFELLSSKLPILFELLPDFFAAVIGVLKPEIPEKPVLVLKEQESVVKSTSHPEMSISMLTESKNVVFEGSPFCFCEADASISFLYPQGTRHSRCYS